MRQQLGLFDDDHGVYVDDPPAVAGQQFCRMAQEHAAVRPFPLRIRGRKELPYVALSRRAQHRIGDRVQQDVAVRVAQQTLVGLDRDPAQD